MNHDWIQGCGLAGSSPRDSIICLLCVSVVSEIDKYIARQTDSQVETGQASCYSDHQLSHPHLQFMTDPVHANITDTNWLTNFEPICSIS